MIARLLAPHHLTILGGFHATPDDALPKGTQTLLMIGPGEGFWPHVTAQPEWDGAQDPIDRWSRRVIGTIACDLGAKALFPFGGPPYHPFYTWAVRLLVHEAQGLMVSFRGALALKEKTEVPGPATLPCNTCAAPCLTACPAAALTGAGYDVPGCHRYLDTAPGVMCMSQGCAVRRACPLSQSHARMPEQSAYHMGQFHK
jgi:epoxyqueuosine reductase